MSSHPTNLRILLTAEEAADLLRISREALYMRIARGTLPGVFRVGRSVRIRRDAVMRGGTER